MTVDEDSDCHTVLNDCTSDAVDVKVIGCSCMTDSATVGKTCVRDRDHQNGNVSDARRNMNDFCSFPYPAVDLWIGSVNGIGDWQLQKWTEHHTQREHIDGTRTI